MAEEKDVFKNKKTSEKRLTMFGFRQDGGRLLYEEDILQGQFCLRVRAENEGMDGWKMTDEVIDKETGEAYVLHLVGEAEGEFVGAIRGEHARVLRKIAENCFEADEGGGRFSFAQTGQALAYAKERYGDEAEFLWEKLPDCAVLRRKDTKKWYAVILTAEWKKLALPGEGKAEILDLRMQPGEAEDLLDGVRFLPGYHMNKRHWVSIPLDGRVDMDVIFARIDRSYLLAGAAGSAGKR